MSVNEKEDIIEGRNAVFEALRAGRPIHKVYIAKGDIDKTLRRIASEARNRGAVVSEADRRKLDFLCGNSAHQGVVAVAAIREYCSVGDILQIAGERGEDPFVIVCDEISDAHNLGAIIRTAESCGAHGVIIPKRRSAGLAPIVAKTSAGAVEHLAVSRVSNISAALGQLKDAGLWVFGSAAQGEKSLWEADFTGPICMVIGSEGQGMGRLVSENCDFLVSIPMLGKTPSLNASAAAAVLMYEAVRQRRPAAQG